MFLTHYEPIPEERHTAIIAGCFSTLHKLKIDTSVMTIHSILSAHDQISCADYDVVVMTAPDGKMHNYVMPQHSEDVTHVSVRDVDGVAQMVIPIERYATMYGGDILSKMDKGDNIEEAVYSEVNPTIDVPRQSVEAHVDREAFIDKCQGWLIANETDGEDRRGTRDRLTYTPDSLADLIEEMIRDCFPGQE